MAVLKRAALAFVLLCSCAPITVPVAPPPSRLPPIPVIGRSPKLINADSTWQLIVIPCGLTTDVPALRIIIVPECRPEPWFFRRGMTRT